MGIFYGILSGATFGMIPLFSLPLLADGISISATLTYRFGLATLIVGGILFFKKENLAIGWLPCLKIFLLSVFYMLAVGFFYCAFRYLPSGIVATIQFQYPIIVILIMVCFFHEQFRWLIGMAAVLAVAGVAILSLNPGQAPALDAEAAMMPERVLVGVGLSLAAGISNGLYFIGIQVAKLPKMNGLVMTFYVMMFGAIFCLIHALATSSFVWLDTPKDLTNAVLLAVVTAVISNLTLILSIRMVGSSLASILGVAEPLTAVLIGIIVFGETLTFQIALGITLIIFSVILALLPKKSQPEPKKRQSA